MQYDAKPIKESRNGVALVADDEWRGVERPGIYFFKLVGGAIKTLS